MTHEETLMRTAPVIELRVSLVANSGEPMWTWVDGKWVVLFHSAAERAVWLDSMREAGMKG